VELAGNILALAFLLLHAALLLGARQVRVSVVALLRVLRQALEHVRYRCRLPRIAARLRTALRDDYVRSSSKRARDWLHKKTEHPPGPPHFRRPNRHEITVIQSFFLHPEGTLG
jgi:hypothetical protein